MSGCASCFKVNIDNCDSHKGLDSYPCPWKRVYSLGMEEMKDTEVGWSVASSSWWCSWGSASLHLWAPGFQGAWLCLAFPGEIWTQVFLLSSKCSNGPHPQTTFPLLSFVEIYGLLICAVWITQYEINRWKLCGFLVVETRNWFKFWEFHSVSCLRLLRTCINTSCHCTLSYL